MVGTFRYCKLAGTLFSPENFGGNPFFPLKGGFCPLFLVKKLPAKFTKRSPAKFYKMELPPNLTVHKIPTEIPTDQYQYMVYQYRYRKAASIKTVYNTSLVEHGADFWRSVIRLKDLSYPCPCPPSLLDLAPHCPDVLVTLGENSPEVAKRLNLLQDFPFDVE